MYRSAQIIFLLLCAQRAVSQDTLRNTSVVKNPNTSSEKKKSYPLFRPLTVSYDVIGNFDVTAQTQQADIGKADVRSNNRIRINGAFPVYLKKKFTASVSFAYMHQQADVKAAGITGGVVNERSFSPDNFVIGLNTIYRDSLFNKPVIYGATLLTETRSFNRIQKWSGLLSASLIIKQTPKKLITVGLVGIVDPSAPFPVFPSFTYWQRMGNSPWELQAILPARIMFKRANTAGGWLNIGTEMLGSRFYNSNTNNLNNTNYVFQSAELISSIGFERHLSPYLFAGVKAGWRTGINSRLLEVNAKNNDYLLRNSGASSPYASVSLSLLLPR